MMQGISVALSGLYAAQKAMDTTGNNIANVNTPGYSRQRVDLQAIGSKMSSMHGDINATGLGVRIEQIARLRDQYLEMTALSENGKGGYTDRAAEIFNNIETTFGEPSDTGIQRQLVDFWKTWDAIASSPRDAAVRTGAVQTAQTLVSTLSATSKALQTQRDNTISELRGTLEEINSIAKNLAEINKTLLKVDASDGNSNNMMDTRDQLIAKLSTLADITVNEADNGSIGISLGGATLVRGDRAKSLELDDSGTPAVLRWNDGDNDASTGFEAYVASGKTGALMDAINVSYPKYRDLLDTTAKSVIDVVNAQHQLGKDLDGNPGGPFFTGTTAASMAIHPDIVADPRKIAAADLAAGNLDVSNADKISKLGLLVDGPDSKYRQLINGLGIESQRATRNKEIQTNITKAANDSAESVSGVNLDEEMTNLMRFQHSYSASAKYLSTLNQVMDSLLSIV